MPAGYALRIKTHSIHTFGMRFALDLVWLGRDGRVVRVDHARRAAADEALLRARSVIETARRRGRRVRRRPRRPVGGYT